MRAPSVHAGASRTLPLSNGRITWKGAWGVQSEGPTGSRTGRVPTRRPLPRGGW